MHAAIMDDCQRGPLQCDREVARVGIAATVCGSDVDAIRRAPRKRRSRRWRRGDGDIRAAIVRCRDHPGHNGIRSARIDDHVGWAMNRRRYGIHDRHPLSAGSALVLAAVKCDPYPRDNVVARNAIRERGDHADNRVRAAVIRCRRWIECPRSAALDGLIRRAGQCRWSRVHDGDRLAAGIGIAAAILCHPEACDDLWARAGVSEGPEYRDALQAAIVRRHRRVKAPGRTAFYGPVAGTEREEWRNRIHVGDRLAAHIGIATAIFGHPHTSDDLRADTGVGESAVNEDASEAAIVLCDGHIKLPRRTALHCSIGWAECEYGRSCVHHRHGLAAIDCDSGAIGHQPVASDKRRATAIGFRVDDRECYVCAAAGVGRLWIIESPGSATLVRFVWWTKERCGTWRVGRRCDFESEAQRNALRIDQCIPRRREWRIAPDGGVVVILVGRMPAEQDL